MTLEVRADNPAAQQLYRRFGFARVGIRPKYYEGTVDAWIMWAGNLQSESYQQRLARTFGGADEGITMLEYQRGSSFRPSLVLALETSCDETSVAILKDGQQVVCNRIASQEELHARYGEAARKIRMPARTLRSSIRSSRKCSKTVP